MQNGIENNKKNKVCGLILRDTPDLKIEVMITKNTNPIVIHE